MSFNFKGTFNKSQFDRLEAFVRSQTPMIDARILHIAAELGRTGYLIMKFDHGTPLGYGPSSDDCYLAKLLAAYEVLGGNPTYDLQLRSINDPVYLLKGSEAGPSKIMSNGEAVGAKGLNDALSARLVEQSRSWLDDTLYRRFDYLERKIRRVMDYSDQLQTEASLLFRIKQTSEDENSLEYALNAIKQLFGDPVYRAIYDDNGKDPHGKYSYAPFSAYEPGGTRPPSAGPERTAKGVVLPGDPT